MVETSVLNHVYVWNDDRCPTNFLLAFKNTHIGFVSNKGRLLTSGLGAFRQKFEYTAEARDQRLYNTKLCVESMVILDGTKEKLMFMEDAAMLPLSLRIFLQMVSILTSNDVKVQSSTSLRFSDLICIHLLVELFK